jgi:hypothetical protein
LIDRYGVKSIYIATDDDQVIQDTKNYPQYKWYFMKNQDRSDLKKIYWDSNLRSGNLDNYVEGQNVITDLSLLSEGDMFVGKFTSNIDRISYSLLVAKKQSYVPYISLDSTWCMDWGKDAGVSVYGMFHY